MGSTESKPPSMFGGIPYILAPIVATPFIETEMPIEKLNVLSQLSLELKARILDLGSANHIS